MSQLRRLLGCVVLTVSPITACTLITHFDDVVPAKGAGGNGGANTGGSVGTGGTGNSAGTTTSGGDAGESAGGAPPNVPMHGVLAVAGTDPTKADANVLSLIDPTTGKEITRQTLVGAAVAGLAYDGAEGKDVWFEFTAATFPAATDSKSDLQVYAFADADSSWKTVSGKVTALPPPRPDSFVVLNDRLSYLSYDNTGADSLTVLDTTDPKAITQIKFTAPVFGGEVLGMVGTRGAPGDPTATGGTLAILIGNTCTGKNAARVCAKLQLLPVFVGTDDVSTTTIKDYSATFGGQPAFASAQSTQLAYVVFPPATGNVKLQYFDPRDLTKITPISVAFASRWLGGLAYAECQKVAVFTAVAEGQLYAVSPTGLTQKVDLGYPGESVVYEPFTGHAITLFNPNDAAFADSGFVPTAGEGGAGGEAGDTKPALDSFNVTANAVLTATASAQWQPPTNLAPNLAVARFPVSYACK
jgi:hypothetical protein